MVTLKDVSHSLNSPRQTEELAWEKIDWIKFSVSELKALPLSSGILAMPWEYGGQTKREELTPVVIQLQESAKTNHSLSLKTMKNLTGVFPTGKTG
jgi:hypothetical protein